MVSSLPARDLERRPPWLSLAQPPLDSQHPCSLPEPFGPVLLGKPKFPPWRLQTEQAGGYTKNLVVVEITVSVTREHPKSRLISNNMLRSPSVGDTVAPIRSGIFPLSKALTSFARVKLELTIEHVLSASGDCYVGTLAHHLLFDRAEDVSVAKGKIHG